jgi:RNA polymerase sigma factor (sigma-70 family)
MNLTKFKQSAYHRFGDEIKAIPRLTKKEEKERITRLNYHKENIDMIIADTNYFFDRLTEISNHLNNEKKKKFRHFYSWNTIKEVGVEGLINLFNQQYKKIDNLFNQKKKVKSNEIEILNEKIRMEYKKVKLTDNVGIGIFSYLVSTNWEIKTIEFDIETYEEQNKIMFKLFKKTSKPEFGQKYLSTQEKLKKLNLKLNQITKKLEISREDLNYKVKKIEFHNEQIDLIKEELLIRNLKLAKFFAKNENYLTHCIEGLMVGINLFDSKYNAKVSTYATYWIQQKQIRAKQQYGRTIRLPVHMQNRLRVMWKVEYEHLDKHHELPDEVKHWQLYNKYWDKRDLKAPHKLNFKKFREIRTFYNSTKTMSFDYKMAGKDGVENTELNEVYEYKPFQQRHLNLSDNYVMDSDLSQKVKEMLGTLSSREERYLSMRFGIGINGKHTLEEIGQMENLTRERVRQIEAKALKKLRQPSRNKKFIGYLE